MLASDAIAAETLEVLQKHEILINYPKICVIEGKNLQQAKLEDAFPQQHDLDEMNTAKTSNIICILLPTTFLLTSHLLPLKGLCSTGRSLVSKPGNSKRRWNESRKKSRKNLEVKDGANTTFSKHPSPKGLLQPLHPQ